MNTDMLRMRIEIDKDALKIELKTDLSRLADDIVNALRSLAKGERLPARLIANEAMLTASIALWNQLLDVMPYLNEVGEK